MATKRIWDPIHRRYRTIEVPNYYAAGAVADDSFQAGNAVASFDSHPEASAAMQQIAQLQQQISGSTNPRVIRKLNGQLRHWQHVLDQAKRKYGGFSGLGAGDTGVSSYALYALGAYLLYRLLK